MTRSSRRHADDDILDRAAALFARSGVARTSVQEIADAVGLSKAGLLHHFPSKELLRAAVVEHADRVARRVVDAVEGIPPGVERDRRAVELVVDVALAHPGLVSMLLSPVLGEEPEDTPPAEGAGCSVLQAFGIDAATFPDPADTERSVRVVGALAGLAVLALAATGHDQTTEWRPHIVATCLDALGHPRTPTSTTPIHDLLEA